LVIPDVKDLRVTGIKWRLGVSGSDDVLQAASDSPPDARQRAKSVRLLGHLDAAYNLARWLCHSEHDAQDIVQESFLRAVRFIDQCRDDEPRTWLLKIVRNTCHTWHARRRTASTSDEMLNQVPSASTSPDRALERAQQASDVHRAIESLPDEFREAVVLREIEGLSYKEVAAVIGVPIGTVMSRLSRARERLKDLLAQYDGEGSHGL
jgi:RNA polymerase sigma-70 factor (ECF subfamily)